MMYSPSSNTVAKQTNEALRRVPADRVWAGIAIYNQSVNDAAAKIREARRKGIDGFAIFSYNSLSGGARDLRKLTASARAESR